jgi:hypothetical protein
MGCGMVYRSVMYAYWVWVSGICRVENTPPESVEALKKSHRKLSKIEDITPKQKSNLRRVFDHNLLV